MDALRPDHAPPPNGVECAPATPEAATGEPGPCGMPVAPSQRDGERRRRAVLEAIATTPGITKKRLGEALGVQWNTIYHHVRVLERAGLVVVDDRGWSHELFPVSTPAAHRRWLRALADERTGRVLESVVAQPGVGVYALSDDLGLSRKAIRTQLSRLIDDGLVRRVGSARPRYLPAEPPPGFEPLGRHL